MTDRCCFVFCLGFLSFLLAAIGLVIFLPTYYLVYLPEPSSDYVMTTCRIRDFQVMNETCNNIEDMNHENQNGGVCIPAGQCTQSCLLVSYGFVGYCCSGGTCCTDSDSGHCGGYQPDGNYKLLITGWKTCYTLTWSIVSDRLPQRHFPQVKYCNYYSDPTCRLTPTVNDSFSCWSPLDPNGHLIYNGGVPPKSDRQESAIAGLFFGALFWLAACIMCGFTICIPCQANNYEEFGEQ